VGREKLYEEMKRLKIPDKLIRLVKMTKTDPRSRVKIQDDLSGEIKIEGACKSRCISINLMCSMFVHYIVQKH
jgi:hypothetical protein